MNPHVRSLGAARGQRPTGPAAPAGAGAAGAVPFLDPLYAAQAGWETWLGGRLPPQEIAARRDAASGKLRRVQVLQTAR
jgi:hypothetical protein